MTFRFRRIRFSFRAQGSVYFPEGKASNVVRGAFGILLEKVSPEAYARVFSPHAQTGPSGLADQPRPFVFRASHLDGARFADGDTFDFTMNLFDLDEGLMTPIRLAFAMLEWTGLGPGRARVVLASVTHELQTVSLAPDPKAAALTALQLRFITPTEIKSKGEMVERPDFGPLFARIRDRVANIYERQHSRPLKIDFRGMGERAQLIRMTQCEVRTVEVDRRSSRTGQEHSIGGFIGEASYEGALGEFVPYLAAAEHTGVGRQTVWGKGEIRVIPAGESK